MPFRRTAAVVAVALAALATAPLLASAQADPATPAPTRPAEVAAGWLARQLVDGDHVEHADSPHPGLTLDVGFALAASGVARDSLDRVTAWLARPETLANYLHFNTPDTESFAGAHAKLALFAQVVGADPTDFGGVDLIAGLTALEADSGRFSDRSKWGDYSNGFSQALAVLALERAGGASERAVTYLVNSRCGDEGYPLFLEAETCESDVDATALAAQALRAAGRTDEAAEALAWLDEVQQPSGGFRDEDTGEGNANSTGLAAQALRAGDLAEAADEAEAFLRSLQVGCGGPEAQRGALAFERTGFDPANATFATAQGVLGLSGVGFAEMSATGGRPGAPVLDCAGTTTTATTTTTTTETTTSTTAGTSTDSTTSTTAAGGTATTTTAAVVTVAGGGDLARTGVSVGPALWLGSLTLIAGVLLLLLARTRYAEERS